MFFPLIGLEVGFVLSFLEATFLPLHLDGTLPIPLHFYAFNVLFAHATYGFDRLEDVRNGQASSEELVSYVSAHEQQIEVTTGLSMLAMSCYLGIREDTIVYIPILYLLITQYRAFKQRLPVLKPFLIAAAITTAAVVLPSVLLEHNYSVLRDANCVLPPFLNLVGTSTSLDIVDLESDRDNGLYTLPVYLGRDLAAGFSKTLVGLSSISQALHPHAASHLLRTCLFQGSNLLSLRPKSDGDMPDFRDRGPKMNYARCSALSMMCRPKLRMHHNTF